MAEHFASRATVVLERAQLTESVILRMIRMAAERDPAETGPHIERVAGYSLVVFDEWARRRGFEGPGFERQRDRLRPHLGAEAVVHRRRRRLSRH